MQKSVFPDRLQKALEDKGMKQNELADLSQTTEATISRYLRGDRAPHVDVLVEISKALNVSIDYLLGVTDIPYINSAYTTEERLLVAAFNKASERDSSIIWQLLDPYLTQSERGSLSRYRASSVKAEA